MNYGDPIAPGKGKKDGHCNRTSCQDSLTGQEQWFMDDFRGGRLYYCGKCARIFNESNRKFREPPRCTFDDETDMSDTLA